MKEPKLMQVTEVRVEKYHRIKEIHLLKLGTGEWKEKILYRWKNAQSNERVNKTFEIGNYESISYGG